MADSLTINLHSTHSTLLVGVDGAASMANVSNRRGFFEIPLEIRSIIYKQAGLDRNASLIPVFNRPSGNDSKPASVLTVSKAFTEQLAPLIYGSREFWLPDVDASMKFINTIGPNNAAYIHHYHVQVFGLKRHNGSSQIQSLNVFLKSMTDNCPNLRSFKVNYITLRRYAKLTSPPKSITRGWGSFEDIKEIGNVFHQLSNISYLQRCWQLCLAAPDEADDNHIYDWIQPWDSETFNLQMKFREYQRRKDARR